MTSAEETKVIRALNSNWVWSEDWVDSSAGNSAGRIVSFRRSFNLPELAQRALIHFSADTRYKLYVNGHRVAVGPARSSPLIWYYDSQDIAPHLVIGDNEIEFVVLRFFASARGAMPFERTFWPGLTVFGAIEVGDSTISLHTAGNGWKAQSLEKLSYPMGLIDDVFLHINERGSPSSVSPAMDTKSYNINTLNGEISPWPLRPRAIPMPEETPAAIKTVRKCQSSISRDEWALWLKGKNSLSLPGGSSHTIELQADVHSTAFVKWTFKAGKATNLILKVTYSEGYEREPRQYPFFRTKEDRLDADGGQLIGPFDEVSIDIPGQNPFTYEPFWFRTFRVLRMELTIGSNPVDLVSFSAMQVNYPMEVQASWDDPHDTDSGQIWDVSVRTMRNCMFDGYSDCPFYEQLQYSCDSRSVGLFHYLISGDDRLMRQTLDNFAASITPSGLTQSRFPSQVKQIIAGFPLYWILQVCDHHLYFGDTKYSKSFLPRIDGVLEFFDSHTDSRGLVSGLPDEVWQYVDWVTLWGATSEHPDKGVPTSGRKSNLHTYFSLLYAYVLKQAAQLTRDVNRPAHATEYEARADSVLEAVQLYCYDGQFYTDSTADIADESAYSQQCQVFAVLAGAASPDQSARLLKESFSNSSFSKCSYMMQFYALRAFACAGDEVYEFFWPRTWDPWRQMLANNLTTWEEDDVRQRSDCHAWGSVPLYEYCTEVAGVQPIAAGSSKVLFKPRLALSPSIKARIALGKDNIAEVRWKSEASGRKHVSLHLEKAVQLISQLPGRSRTDHGVTDRIDLVYDSQ